MIRSMTGFARAETATPQGQLLWEVRSINHRYLEVQLKLPDFARELESDLRQFATAQLGRGRVEGSLSLRAGDNRAPAGRVNSALVRQLAGHLKAVGDELGNSAPVSPLEILRWPGVLEQEEQAPAALHPVVIQSFEAVIADLNGARSREGARIHEMLERRLAEIETHVADVITRLPVVLTRIRERMAERVAALGVPADPDRLEQEVVILAQKMDVSEELDRLRAHLAEFRDTLKSDAPVGRRLDFLVQELNREANTLASKSADADTTRQAVDIKVLIEQIREQVQNVE
ncbi:MAG: YicC family protein [Gammaproteobacteria bacterium]|nr:YicC family protein [Gammaproteobacteria bacterium]MDH5275211.1 YicC family protein [Gammaproteobacteria bacterium]